MSSPEASQQERPFSPQEQKLWASFIKQVALRALQPMEALYLSEEEREARKTAPLTNERYQEWLEWMNKVDEDPKSLFRQYTFVDEGALANNAKIFVFAMEALEELRGTQRLSLSAKKKLGIELHEEEYLVPVDYGPLPSKEELEKEFPDPDAVSELFDGRPWVKRASCANINEANGTRFMKLFYFNDAFSIDDSGEAFTSEDTSKEIIAHAAKEGYRPATEKELLALAKAQPELQRQFWIVALGAFALDRFDGRVEEYVGTLLSDEGRRRYLGVSCPGDGWPHGSRFLFVRETEPG